MKPACYLKKAGISREGSIFPSRLFVLARRWWTGGTIKKKEILFKIFQRGLRL